jgi:hypothetical protein
LTFFIRSSFSSRLLPELLNYQWRRLSRAGHILEKLKGIPVLNLLFSPVAGDLVTIAGLSLIVVAFFRIENHIRKDPEEDHVEGQKPSPDFYAALASVKDEIANLQDLPPIDPTAPAVLRITPPELCEIVSQNTKINSDKLLSVYVGKSLSVSGRVHDVNDRGTYWVVFLLYSPSLIAVLLFSNEWKDHLSQLSKKDAIMVIGTFKEAQHSTVWLENCSLVWSKQIYS